MVLLISGVVFKLSAAPFHMWTPDVYEGAPAPVTAYLATVSKGATIALFLRFFWQIRVEGALETNWLLETFAILSMFAGNLLALFQRNVKRILAYSSTANMGYVLVAFLTSANDAQDVVALYLIAYMVTILAAFAILSVLENEGHQKVNLEDFRSFAADHQWLAFALALSLFSLIGVPLTAGFAGKFAVLGAGAKAHHWYLVASIVASSIIGIYVYLRIVIAMYSRAIPALPYARPERPTSIWARVVVASALLFVVGIGVWPSMLLEIF